MIAFSALEAFRQVDGSLLLSALQVQLVDTTLGDH